MATTTGNVAISVIFQNRSSLKRRDAEIIQDGLSNALKAMGARFVQNDPAAARVEITLSENLSSYVWVAQVKGNGVQAAVVMVSVARASNANVMREALPLSLRKIPLWSQTEPILDVAVLEENAAPARIAVLSAEKVSIYRLRGGTSQLEAAFPITHSRPWPRDLRGRIVLSRDHLVDVYLPGTMCQGSAAMPLALICRDGNDAWPLLNVTVSGVGASALSVRGRFDASRNFFTSIQSPAGLGTLKNVPAFYSTAWVQKDSSSWWLFATVDGQIHIIDSVTDRALPLNWGSSLTSIRTSCGAGWQILSTSVAVDGTDSVRAFEIPDSLPVPVSAATDFPGPVSAMWSEAKGDSAVAIAKNRETGNYEAFRLAVACDH